MDPNTISYIIRAKNEGRFIGRLLEVLRSQIGYSDGPEIVLVDNASTDETVAIARSFGARVISVADRDFDYSMALNLGIEESRGDLLIILSAHAIPCTSDWVAALLAHFDDTRVAGVFSRQIPWPDANWREVLRLQSTFGEVSESFNSTRADGTVPFSNAASSVRRSVWRQHPFALPAAEDIEWATWAATNGYRIIYEASVSVYHSHNETPRQAAWRLIDLEKAADIKMSRHRDSVLTVRQALGAAWRDFKDVRAFTRSPGKRAEALFEAVQRSFWFVKDFRTR